MPLYDRAIYGGFRNKGLPLRSMQPKILYKYFDLWTAATAERMASSLFL